MIKKLLATSLLCSLAALAAPELKQAQTVELVTYGKEVFTRKGCFTCHANTKNDPAIKTGPNLFGLYQQKAKTIEVIDPAENHTVNVPANEAYLRESIREPATLLAISDLKAGTPYPAMMPAFNKAALNELELTALLAYLQTCNEPANAGPATVERSLGDFNVETPKNVKEAYVGTRPLLHRGTLNKGPRGPRYASARAYLVGTPHRTHYAFDPNVMGFRLVWSGGFLERSGEVKGRGGNPVVLGTSANVWDLQGHLLQPIVNDQPFVDTYTTPFELNKTLIAQYNADKSDYIATANAIPARLLGVDVPRNEAPRFRYRVKDNEVAVRLEVTDPKTLRVTLDANLRTPQAFTIPKGLTITPPKVGTLADGKWNLPAGDHQLELVLATDAQFPEAKLPTVSENWQPQELRWKPSEKQGSLPAGYALETGSLPTDLIGRRILAEPLGIVWADKNTAFVSTRTAGIWKLVNNKWHKFAEGFYDSLGLALDADGSVVVGDKTGLVRLFDRDNDHWSESRETINEQFRLTGVYHEYLHGPVRIGEDYYFNLNLSYKTGLYEGGMTWMATCGGLRGWTCKVTKDGTLIPFASGMRSTAGIGVSPDGKLFVTENQGSFVGTSTMHQVNEGDFTHSPISLIDEPGKHVGHPGVQYDAVLPRKKRAVMVFPHGKTLNSPGNPEWLRKDDAFGPFAGQTLVGDQTTSRMWRMALEEVDGQLQGALLPFGKGFASGLMRIVQSPDGKSVWLGQTGRGWRSVGGNEYALQRITYDGTTIPNVIQSVSATCTGFEIVFTQKQENAAAFKRMGAQSWHYIDTRKYGSPNLGHLNHPIKSTTLSDDGKCLTVELGNFTADVGDNPRHSPRVYHLTLTNTPLGKKIGYFQSQAFYTLHKIPNH